MILLVFLVGVVLLSLIQDWQIAFLLFLILIFLNKKKLNQKNFWMKWIFILIITQITVFSYVVVKYLYERIFLWEFYLLFQLRVMNIYLFSFWFFERFSFFDVLSFSKDLIIFFSIAISVIFHYSRVIKEYPEILKSRGYKLSGIKENLLFYSNFLINLFIKFSKEIEEISQILESRGVFYSYDSTYSSSSKDKVFL
ncbi:MAG: hypothetical protein NZ853_02020 [Leptospiraceae bacterium]|nr:hypothetical protein [Leptospiraceae bacterium]MDW7975997.1 hypothetical protein [Leptospiraceae bacterium]